MSGLTEMVELQHGSQCDFGDSARQIDSREEVDQD